MSFALPMRVEVAYLTHTLHVSTGVTVVVGTSTAVTCVHGQLAPKREEGLSSPPSTSRAFANIGTAPGDEDHPDRMSKRASSIRSVSILL